MSGSKSSLFLRQLEQLAEVTSATPNRVWNRSHKLETDVGNLHTPPRSRLLLPFSMKDILSKSNEVEPSPDQSSKGSFIQPYEKVSPSPGLGTIQTYEKVLPNPARNCLLNPNSNGSSDDSEDAGENEVEILVLDMFVMKSNEVALRNDDTASSSSESGFYTQ